MSQTPALTKTNVAEVRRAVGLTQDVLAVRAGMSRSGLQKVESGRAVPQETTMRALAAALGVPYESSERVA